MRISDWSSDVCSSDLPSVRPELVEGLSFPLDGEWKNGPSTSSGQTDLKAPSLVEHDHRPCGVALLHLVESIVDLFERYRLGDDAVEVRSEEHTSELQSLMRNSYAVFCLNKKKQPTHL